MDFVAIDFETANERRSSPCSVGLAVFKNGEVVEAVHKLIRPKGNQFNSWNVRIHGITPGRVDGEPEFPDIWPLIRDKLQSSIVIAHNASFDMSVLRATLDEYQICYPELTYSCTRLIAQATWTDLPSYNLSLIAATLGIDFKHHDALEDAITCAQVAKSACEQNETDTLDELAKRLRIRHGRLYSYGSYTAASGPRTLRGSGRIDISEIEPEGEVEQDHLFYNRQIAFTGTLLSMTRREAIQRAVNVGGQPAESVTKSTNYLVVGHLDPRTLAVGESLSSKCRKAMAMREKGFDIEILSEDDFLRML